MLTIALIDRLFTNERYFNLLRELSRNYLPLPEPVQLKLSDAPAGIVGLGLRRVIDLAFIPVVTGRAMLGFILDHQTEQGDFDHCPIATAACIGALSRWTREYGGLSSHEGAISNAQIDTARARAIDRLNLMRDPSDGLFIHPADRTLQDRQLTSAVVLLLLGTDSLAVETLRLWETRNTLHEMSLDLDAARFLEMADASESPAIAHHKAA